jgi:hypothetical protein
MPLSYLQNKVHIYKWRDDNREKYNEVNKKFVRRGRAWKKEQLIFLRILFLD